MSSLTSTEPSIHSAKPTGTGDSIGSSISFDHVSKVYQGTTPVVALNDITLSIGVGELVAVVGTSGSGKSTLMNLMGGLDVATEGTVKIQGHVVNELSDADLSTLRGEQIGFVFQSFHLLGTTSVVENVAMGTMYRGDKRRDRILEAERTLERVGLGHRVRHKANTLSGGERQRVAVARALLGSPPILLADEPTGNLDSATGASILDLLLDIHAEGTTVVVITHDTKLAGRFDRQIRIADGKLADASSE